METDLAASFKKNGFVVLRELFSAVEVLDFVEHFMDLREGVTPTDEVEMDRSSSDPLVRFPRLMHPHRWDDKSFGFLTDPRIDRVISEITGASPIAVQTMVYFKPPGGRGQALHQDNFYLAAKPGTCMAAWLALDDCDEGNGCMSVVPGSHRLPTLCVGPTDSQESFTDVGLEVPPGMEAVPATMKAGDVLFFDGQLIHGSGPNRSDTRFRRSLIGHYVSGEATQVGRWYKPCYRMDGTEAILDDGEGEPECGRFVESKLEMVAGGHYEPGGPH